MVVDVETEEQESGRPAVEDNEGESLGEVDIEVKAAKTELPMNELDEDAVERRHDESVEAGRMSSGRGVVSCCRAPWSGTVEVIYDLCTLYIRVKKEKGRGARGVGRSGSTPDGCGHGM